ncbi:MAG: hypothetical protein ACI4NM_02870, partial [Bullifex sp.]
GASWGETYSTGLAEDALAELFAGMCEITGGTFSSDPSAYVDTENYEVTLNESTWSVTAK